MSKPTDPDPATPKGPLRPVARPRSLSDLAYEQLKTGILTGKFRVGQRISVVQAAEQLSMSRSPVRAAVERLSAEGLVTIDANGFELMEYDRDDLLDTLTVRAPLEALAARLAAERATSEDHASLSAIHARFAEAVAANNSITVYEFDVGFHFEIWRLTGNAVLEQELHRLQDRGVVASHTISWTPAPVASVHEHVAIRDAIVAGDGTTAATLALDHIEQLRERVRTGAAAPIY